MKTKRCHAWLLAFSASLAVSLACGVMSEAVETTVVGADHFLIPGLDIDVSYTVSSEGEARFWLDEYPDIEPLTSRIDSQETGMVEWRGVVLDGYGVLDSAQGKILADFYTSPYSQALPLIALERGCQAGGDLTAEQLAALLFPWQMHLKYSPIDRMAEIRYFLEKSGCEAFFSGLTPFENGDEAPFIMISNDSPFPVVYGYFPFDPEGAFEIEGASLAGCQLSKPVDPEGNAETAIEIPLFDTIPFNQLGPCGSKCRGACGINCTLSNCTVEDVFRCFTDANNELTGFGIQVQRYTCGVHDGCVTHDACYDSCNRGYGCSSFWSAWCSHGTKTGNCDGDCFAKYGYTQCVTWARGKGPFSPSKKVFDYTSSGNPEEYGVENLEACPAKRELDISKVTPVQFTISGDFEETLWDENFPIDANLCSPGKGRFSFTFWNVGALAGGNYGRVTAANSSTPYFEYYLAEWAGETIDRCVTYDYAVDQSGKEFHFSGGPNGVLTLGDQVIGTFYEGRTFQFHNVGFSPRTFSVPDPSVFSAWE